MCASPAELFRQLEKLDGDMPVLHRLFPVPADFLCEFSAYAQTIKDNAGMADCEWVQGELDCIWVKHGNAVAKSKA